VLKISKLRRLKELGITNTYVTDRGLKYLEQVKSLRWVWVCENNKLTTRGIASLQRALPAANVSVMNRPKTNSAEQKLQTNGDKKSP
jgi:hypothetical protein